MFRRKRRRRQHNERVPRPDLLHRVVEQELWAMHGGQVACIGRRRLHAEVRAVGARTSPGRYLAFVSSVTYAFRPVRAISTRQGVAVRARRRWLAVRLRSGGGRAAGCRLVWI